MAITIIKGGKNEFVGHCQWCGCDFRYTEEDICNGIEMTIRCPHCERFIIHYGEHGTSIGSAFSGRGDK